MRANDNPAYRTLCERFGTAGRLYAAKISLFWDSQTYMPQGGRLGSGRAIGGDRCRPAGSDSRTRCRSAVRRPQVRRSRRSTQPNAPTFARCAACRATTLLCRRH